MKYALDKYDYFQYKDGTGKTTIAAMSTYAGRYVKGYAKCDPHDTMDVQKGRELAAARCNAKIAAKRLKRANQKFTEAKQQSVDAKRFYNRMAQYYIDATDEVEAANAEVERLLSEM